MPRPLACGEARGSAWGRGKTDSDIKIALAARELAYGVFWRLFSEEPDFELLKTLQCEEFETALHLIVGEGAFDEDCLEGLVGEMARKMELDADGFLDELKSEYTRDFVGPDKLPAYSLGIHEHRRRQEPVSGLHHRGCAANWCGTACNPSITARWQTTTLRSSFTSCSSSRKNASTWSMRGASAQARALLEDERSFASRHLLNWVPAYVHDFQKKRDGSFYAFWLGFLLELLKADHGLLGELIDEMA